MKQTVAPVSATSLGKNALAVRVSGGTVPSGCLGAAITADGVIQKYLEGRAIGGGNDKVWWVHPGSYSLEFAPIVEAPAFGVRLELQVALNGLGAVEDALVQWLGDQKMGGLTLACMESKLRNHELIRHFPTCVQPEECRKISELLSEDLVREMGLVCTQVKRVNLRSPANCVCVQQVLGDAQAVLPEAANETELANRLFKELPKLAYQLRSMPYPEEAAAGEAYGQVLGLVSHLTNTAISRFPALDENQGEVARRMRVETWRAVEKLERAWDMVSGAEGLNDEKQLRSLWRILAAIQVAIKRRMTMDIYEHGAIN